MPDGFGNGAGGGRRPDDPLAEIRELVESLRARFGGGGGKGGGKGLPSPWPFLAVGLLLWLATGFFIVAPDQRGLVLRFGRLVREVGPGPSYHAPWPIEQVIKPSVTQVRKEEFGFRTIDTGPPARYRAVDREALMLTGDDNIVKLQFIVQYRVRPAEAANFVFQVRDPRGTLRVAAEAAMRQVVGNTEIDAALTSGREEIQRQAEELLQRILDSYEAGIDVVTVKLQDVAPPDPVSDAFKDVISAEQDKERMINEARGYSNDVVPKARGRAAQILNEAEAYRLAKIERARGEAARFVSIYDEYVKARDVTRLRLYLETMEEILPRMRIFLLEKGAGGTVVPYLPLDELRARPAAPAEAAPKRP